MIDMKLLFVAVMVGIIFILGCYVENIPLDKMLIPLLECSSINKLSIINNPIKKWVN